MTKLKLGKPISLKLPEMQRITGRVVVVFGSSIRIAT